MFAPAADDVVAFFEFGEEVRDFAWVVLKIAVHGEDVVALRVIEAGGESGGLTEVAAELDDEDTTVYGSDLFQEAVGAVARAIVNEDQLEGFSDLLHNCFETVVERGDALLFVMERNDDGIFRHLLMILLWECFLDRGKLAVIDVRTGIEVDCKRTKRCQ
jgi:hypothetical protein